MRLWRALTAVVVWGQLLGAQEAWANEPAQIPSAPTSPAKSGSEDGRSPTQPEAAEAELSTDARERSRAWYLVAKQHYDAGRFAAALSALRAAYEASNEPGLLFNMAQAERKLGRCVAATELYERYLKATQVAPGAPAETAQSGGSGRRTEARHWLAALSTCAAAGATPQLPASPAAQAPPAGSAGLAPPAGSASQAPPTPADAVEIRGEQARGKRPAELPLSHARVPTLLEPRAASGEQGASVVPLARLAAWTSAGAAGVAAGFAVGFGLHSNGVAAELSSAEGAWTSDLDERQSAGERSRTAMWISTGAATGFALTSLALFLLDAERQSPAVGVTLAPGSASAEWRQDF